MYANGLGVPKDYAKAAKWYREAADQGYASAQLSLGHMYDKGHGVPQNYGEALKWLRKAAEQGDAGAQFFLALKYFTGEGVPEDYVQAHMWLNLSAPQHGKIGIELRNRVASLMSPAQIAEAQRLARVCLQNNYKDCGVDRPRIARRDEGAPPPAKREVASTGTGFFVSESGHIVTNAHVVEHCLRVRSSLGGPISKVSIDEQSDLALYIASEKPQSVCTPTRGTRCKGWRASSCCGLSVERNTKFGPDCDDGNNICSLRLEK